MVCAFQAIHGTQITNIESTPEIAFSGDTMSDFILDPDNADVLKAKILVVEVYLLISYHFVINLFVVGLFLLSAKGFTLSEFVICSVSFFLFWVLTCSYV